jgi:hypothetical protein
LEVLFILFNFRPIHMTTPHPATQVYLRAMSGQDMQLVVEFMAALAMVKHASPLGQPDAQQVLYRQLLGKKVSRA